MNRTTPLSKITTQQEYLRHQIALIRAREILEDNPVRTFDTSKQHQAARLGNAIRDIHAKLYQDMHGQIDTSATPGNVIGSKKEKLNSIINELAKALYDENGFFKLHSDSDNDLRAYSKAMAHAYNELVQLKPFEYGSAFTARLLITCIGQSAGDGFIISFNRLNSQETQALMSADSDEKTAFTIMRAMKFAPQGQTQDTPVEKFPPPPNKSCEIAGLRFLHDQDSQGRDCLILLNGAKVPREKIEKTMLDHINSNIPLNLLKISREQLDEWNVEYVLPELKDASDIDGINVKNGAPLIFQPANSLTGLSINNHQTLMNFLNSRKPPADWGSYEPPVNLNSETDRLTLELGLRENIEAKRKTLQSADEEKAMEIQRSIDDSERLITLLNIAAENVQALLAKVDRVAKIKCASVQPVSKAHSPHFVMTAGGAGSGKGGTIDELYAICKKDYPSEMENVSLEQFKAREATEVTDEDGNKHHVQRRYYERFFAVASLDEARSVFDRYRIITKLGHHIDDYEAVEEPSRLIRRYTMDKAKGHGLNLLYDCTAIPYQDPKAKNKDYAAIIENFKRSYYDTRIFGSDCMLVIPPARKGEFETDAIDRVISRLHEGDDKRTLPWYVVTTRHIGFMRSILQFIEHEKLDHFTLEDNAGKMGTKKVIAHMIKCDDKELKELLDSKAAGTTQKTLEEHKWLHRNQPFLSEDKTTFLFRRVGGVNRVLVVTDAERLIDIAQKGLMNPKAPGRDALIQTHNKIPFYNPAMDSPGMQIKPGMLGMLNPDFFDPDKRAALEKTTRYTGIMGSSGAVTAR